MKELLQSAGWALKSKSDCAACGGPKEKWIKPGTAYDVTIFTRKKYYTARNNGRLIKTDNEHTLHAFIQSI